jgi:hypothetical protein
MKVLKFPGWRTPDAGSSPRTTRASAGRRASPSRVAGRRAWRLAMLHRLSAPGPRHRIIPAPYHGPHDRRMTQSPVAPVSSSQRGPASGPCRDRSPPPAKPHGKSRRSASDAPALAALARRWQRTRGPAGAGFLLRHGRKHGALARRHPDALVIGVDQSAQRLRRHRAKPETTCSCSAHCEAVWRHLAEHRGCASPHYITSIPTPGPNPGTWRAACTATPPSPAAEPRRDTGAAQQLADLRRGVRRRPASPGTPSRIGLSTVVSR